MEWLIAAYFVTCAYVLASFKFIYSDGEEETTNKLADIALSVTWPFWVPVLLGLHTITKKERGK